MLSAILPSYGHRKQLLGPHLAPHLIAVDGKLDGELLVCGHALRQRVVKLIFLRVEAMVWVKPHDVENLVNQ